METIFLSYARSDQVLVFQIAADLKAAGADLWIDQHNIPLGQHWDASIERALKQCRAFAIMLSPASTESRNVMDEVNFALEEGKSIVPFLVKHCSVPFRLRRLQYIDFTQDYASALRASVAHLCKLFATGLRVGTNVAREAVHIDNATRVATPERLEGVRVLWVDDKPSNVRYARIMLEGLGAKVCFSLDTNEAMTILNEIEYDIVISDMGRPSGARAGYDLISRIKKAGMDVPILICSGSRSPQHHAEALAAGAQGSTNNAHELLDLIFNCVRL